MNLTLPCNVTLRKPEPEDSPALYLQKNDPDVASQLGGFSTGYSRDAIRDWVDAKARNQNDLVWVIADSSSNECLGHVGLYQLDHRVGSAEFAIMLGAKSAWGHGIGTAVTEAVVHYGFHWLNLHRISLTVLESNARALALYAKVGFHQEGILRDAQYKDGRYLSVIVMSILRSEFPDGL